jgi:glycerol-3-phosphate acyltransferase PlsY
VLLCWFAVLLLTGYVGLATMIAAVALVVAAHWLDPGDTPLLGFCILVAAFVIYTHRSNIARMWTGQENRARVWLFRSRAA